MRGIYALIAIVALGMLGAWGCGEQQEPAGSSAGQQKQTKQVRRPAEKEQDTEDTEAGESNDDGVTCLDIEAPPIDLPDLQGETVTLDEVVQDKYALLVFWATWCPYCEEEIPALNEMHEEYSDTLEILAIDYKESKEKVQSYAEEQGMKYRILLDTEGTVFQRYGITGTPTLMLVRQDGTICWRGRTPAEAEKKLKQLLESKQESDPDK